MPKFLLLEQRQDEGDDGGKKRSQVGEDLVDVLAAAVEDGEDGIADGALEGAASEASAGLHVPGLRLDGASSPEESGQRRRLASAGAGDAMSAIVAVDNS